MTITPEEMPSQYDPKSVEDRIGRTWIDRGLFRADPASKKAPFVITIPPPNITGQLHMGHALNNTLQDILIRWKKMEGREVLYLPGTDHAGIATQNVVEKELKKTEKKNRWDLGREEFLKRVWAWKEQYGSRILEQLRRLGCGCDWSRTRFTMEEAYSRAIRKVFKHYFDKGLVYRGKRIVNWCPACLTALADDEIEYADAKGFLWHIRYPLADGTGHVTVATTRPESMLGDTGVAVHPKDDRYRGLVGKRLILPLMNREIPIVADEAIDMAFGTGAVKVTPAHDKTDYEIGLRHNLPPVVILDERGRTNDEAGRFKGLDRFDARKAVVEALREAGALEREEPYALSQAKCYRSDTVIEPYLSDQWFVKMRPLADAALALRREKGLPRFTPERWGKVYEDWLVNVRDWCISRQIWWGHQIPVWYCRKCNGDRVRGEGPAVRAAADAVPIVAESAPAKCPACGGAELVQDPDVLDTWFSSALWPFATMGWPEATPDLKAFYPTQVLVTASEIIYLWVARMVMSGLEFMGERPFDDVIINPTVLTQTGERMSKSKGTGVDPLELIDQYGADATRFGIVYQITEGQGLKFFPDKVRDLGRNFITKLWNATRFILQTTQEIPLPSKARGSGSDPSAGSGRRDPSHSIPDRWILSRCQTTVDRVTRAMTSYEFGEAARQIYAFVWGDFCDWYIEIAKEQFKGDAAARSGTKEVLFRVLTTSLRLLHPVAPFVTEEIWGKLRVVPGLDLPASLLESEWPKADRSAVDDRLETRMEWVQEFLRSVRDARTNLNIPRQTKVRVTVAAGESERRDVLRELSYAYPALAGIEASSFRVGERLEKEGRVMRAVLPGMEVAVHLDGGVDVSGWVAKQKGQIEKLKGQQKANAAKLANEAFRKNAPPDVIAQIEAKRDELDDQIVKIETGLSDLGGI